MELEPALHVLCAEKGLRQLPPAADPYAKRYTVCLSQVETVSERLRSSLKGLSEEAGKDKRLLPLTSSSCVPEFNLDVSSGQCTSTQVK